MNTIKPTYYTRHPDDTYSVADPQPTIQPVKQEPVAWYDKIKGMEVSVDVSTGEDDAHHRVFGRVDSVMLESCGAQEDIILVIEESRNYAAPVDAKAIRAEERQRCIEAIRKAHHKEL